MKKSMISRRTLAVGVTALLAATAIGLIALHASASSPPPTLSAAAIHDLSAQHGVAVSPPDADAKIDSNQAIAVAEKSYPVGPNPVIHEVGLGRLHSPNNYRFLDGRLAWIVSLSPASGTLPGPNGVFKVAYLYAVIDAASGEPIAAIGAGRNVPAPTSPSIGPSVASSGSRPPRMLSHLSNSVRHKG